MLLLYYFCYISCIYIQLLCFLGVSRYHRTSSWFIKNMYTCWRKNWLFWDRNGKAEMYYLQIQFKQLHRQVNCISGNDFSQNNLWRHNDVISVWFYFFATNNQLATLFGLLLGFPYFYNFFPFFSEFVRLFFFSVAGGCCCCVGDSHGFGHRSLLSILEQ